MENPSTHTFLLSFDVEEFTMPEEMGAIKTKEQQDHLFKISAEGLKKIMKILKEERIIATFFCTYEFFYRYPKLIQQISEEGNEVAIHAYAHKDNYQIMDEKKAIKKLKKAKREIEKKLQITITGFRGPGFRAPSLLVLSNAGFTYDSSIHPTYIPGHYNNLTKSRKIQNDKGWAGTDIAVIPISVVPFLRFPFSWLWFRNSPLLYTKMCTWANMATDKYTLLYFHPWEAIDLKKELKKSEIQLKTSLITTLVLRGTGAKFLQKLKEYIIWAKKRGTFKTIDQYLKMLDHSL
jgi:peptidoglycan/xylan/chitin deacetylase (PgdA/CDA1 family)